MKAVRIFQDVVLALLALAGAASIVLIAAMLIFNVSPSLVLTGSMEPTIKTGAVIISEPQPASQIQIGDVVTVPRTNGEGMITHRVIDTQQTNGNVYTLSLQGDANANPDPSTYQVTTANRYLFSVPGAGYVVQFVKHYPIPAALLLLALLLFSFWDRTRCTVALPNGEILKNVRRHEADLILKSYKDALSEREDPVEPGADERPRRSAPDDAEIPQKEPVPA
jgi:signal peptidase